RRKRLHRRPNHSLKEVWKKPSKKAGKDLRRHLLPRVFQLKVKQRFKAIAANRQGTAQKEGCWK
ncbi:MAG TPA: hypothetical protein PKV86_11930, partial [Syntrophobacteraceae bacterium]|nr:hypothetical protein [Syntrophobacteraceae bacterium]